MKKDSIGNKYSQELYAKTKFYQKRYGFKLESLDGDTHNNEADAFKHAFGAADIALKTTSGISKGITDFHELQQKSNPSYEENMDKWNNLEGRKIADEIRKDYSKESIKILIKSGQMDDIIAERVMIKMRAGKLITNPFTDTRKFNEKTFKDRIFDIKNRVFHKNEVSMKDLDNPVLRDVYLEQALEYEPMPTKEALDKRVQTGELVYVSQYTRGDGTKVSGYYRSYPNNQTARKSISQMTNREVDELLDELI